MNTIDFEELSLAFPPLRKRYLLITSLIRTKHYTTLDFKCPQTLRDLSCAILWKYFEIQLEIPLNTLIPPIPSRLDYLLHIQDKIPSLQQGQECFGLDIGTGASCIYPLLACKMNPNLKFLALDIDKDSVKIAKDNVKLNNMSGLIKVKRNKTDKIFPKRYLKDKVYAFSMCNPPFYSSRQEIEESRSFKVLEPSSVVFINLRFVQDQPMK